MSFSIEKNIPLPMHYDRTTRKYPFDQMSVGDSFLVPCEDRPAETAATLNRLRQAARAYRNRHDKKDQRFNCRTLNRGVRCWRVA